METTEIPTEAVTPSSPENTLLFPGGLPGFSEHRQFSLSSPPDLAPLLYLQSHIAPCPRFFLLPARYVDPGYLLHMETWDRDILYPPPDIPALDRLNSELSVYFVVSVAKNAAPTVNMLAPIAIRSAVNRGVQAVRADSVYSHAWPLATPPGGIH